MESISVFLQEHVLNSPDPNRRILQKNQEDWFYLATENYLGDIEKLEIWFDSAGLKPSWYCSEIEVVDIKTRKYWWFNLKYTFGIGTKENFLVTAEPEALKKNRKCSLKKISLQGNHFWDISRKEEVSISKFKRLTVMLSIFMTTYTSILFLYGSPTMRGSDSLDYYLEYGFHVELIWAAVGGLAITFFLHLPIVHFFRYPREEIIREYGREPSIDHTCSDAICWCFLVFLLLVTMTVLPILGFWVPHVTVLLWLTSAVASILMYIFILENVVRLVENFMMSRATRIGQILPRIKSVLDYMDTQRVFIMKKTGYSSLRPYYEHLYRPLTQSRIKEQKYWAKIREDILEIVQDVVMVTIYVVLLYTVVLKDRDSMTRISNQEVIDLISGVHSRTMYSEEPITDEYEIEFYIKHALIFSMQSLQWYGRFLSRDPGMTIDNNNKYIGIARLRQHRSDNHSCVVHPLMRFLTKHCISPYSNGPEYEDFSEGWGNNTMSDKFARMDMIWKYKTPQITGTSNYHGTFGTYTGGGYVATLGRNLKNSLLNAEYIHRNHWVDRYTRCLLIEFIMYSANSNLFQSVRVSFEMATTGYYLTEYNVRTASLLFIRNAGGVVLLLLISSFVVMVCILFLKLLLKIMKKKRLVLKDMWTIADITIISLSVACMFFYVERSFMVEGFLNDVEKSKHNEFINYFHLFFAETTLTIMAAILIFLATLRLWKLLRFLLIIKIVEKTLRLLVSQLFFVFIYQIFLIFLFQLVGRILFEDQDSNQDSLMSLVLLGLCFLKTYDFESVKTLTQRSFYSIYMVASLFFLTSYVSVITISYGEAQVYHSYRYGYTVFDYLHEQYQYYKWVIAIKMKRIKQRGGRDETSMGEETCFCKDKETSICQMFEGYQEQNSYYDVLNQGHLEEHGIS
ncbi:hypothetical protein JTB14_012738 [Gonioctena quinquepunctata]|nr:hypothetical protein JTB14_012738 [Gonioctena quinquepunctata]